MTLRENQRIWEIKLGALELQYMVLLKGYSSWTHDHKVRLLLSLPLSLPTVPWEQQLSQNNNRDQGHFMSMKWVYSPAVFWQTLPSLPFSSSSKTNITNQKNPKVSCAIVLKQEGSFLMLLVAYNLTIREYLSVNKVRPQSFIITEGIQRTYYNMRYLYIMPIFWKVSPS